MAEGEEGLPVIPKESFVAKIRNKLLGRPPQPQAAETMQSTVTESNQPAAVTPQEAARKLQTGEATEMFKPFRQEIIPPSEQPPSETAADWVKHEYKKFQSTSEIPDQLAENARIDAANLAKMQQPPSEPLPETPPFTQQKTTLPDKVFEPQDKVPGEHEEIEKFLEKKRAGSTEPPQSTGLQNLQSAHQRYRQRSEQPNTPQTGHLGEPRIPVDIPQEAPIGEH